MSEERPEARAARLREVSQRGRSVFKDFKEFLLKQNALALAIGVIIGAAIGKIVSSLAEHVIMPVVGLLLPQGHWREAAWPMKWHIDEKTGQKVIDAAISYGQLLGAIIDFVIVAFVVFLIAKAFLPKPEKKADTKECPQCREIIPAAATRCKACTQPVV